MESLRRWVIVTKFGSISTWKPKAPREGYGCGFWKSIFYGVNDFWKFIHFNLRQSEEIRFWQDIFGLGISLYLRILGLFITLLIIKRDLLLRILILMRGVVGSPN